VSLFIPKPMGFTTVDDVCPICSFGFNKTVCVKIRKIICILFMIISFAKDCENDIFVDKAEFFGILPVGFQAVK